MVQVFVRTLLSEGSLKWKTRRLEDSNLLGSWVAQQADFIHTDMVIGTCQRPLQSPPVSSFLWITFSPQLLTYAVHLWNNQYTIGQNENLRQNMLLQFHPMLEWGLNFVLTQISRWWVLPWINHTATVELLQCSSKWHRFNLKQQVSMVCFVVVEDFWISWKVVLWTCMCLW